MPDKTFKIYLDNNASTPCDPEILDIFQRVSKEIIGNPHSSEHAYGWEAEKVIGESKEKIASFINALADEIIFTSGASEANNLAIIGIATAAKVKGRNRNKIIISAIEHKCIFSAVQYLYDLFGFEIVVVPVNNLGVIDLDFLEKEIDDNTLLVSVIAANNEIGTYQPLFEIGELCKRYNTIFHVDAAQSAYLPIDVVESNIDLLSLSGHKMYAPKGIGVLYINQDISLKPMPIIHGGGQQGGFRSGTLSPALSASMAKAVDIITKNRESEAVKFLSLKNMFLNELKNEGISFKVNGNEANRHPGNLNIQFTGVDARTLILRLQPSIAMSTGSACNSGNIENSYVLRAIGLSDEQIESSVRVSFGRFNTEKDVAFAANQISKEIKIMLEPSWNVAV